MNSNKNYSYQMYEHSKLSLPPNIGIPNTPTINYFLVTINDLIYLNKNTNPLLKIRWWGYKQPHTTVFQNNREMLFPIHSSKTKFLSYCQDMHILQFQLCQNKPHQSFLCKTGINMKTLAMWQGEKHSMVLDLIRNSKKVGEISLSIQIVQKDNLKYDKKGLEYQNQDFNNKPTIAKFIQHSSLQHYSERHQDKSESSYSKITQRNDYQRKQEQQQCNHRVINRKNPQKQARQQFGSCICSSINNYNTEAEIFKLQQDYQLIFGIRNKEHDMQTIQFQFIEWIPSQKVRNKNQKELLVSNSQTVTIQFPLPNRQLNRYELKGSQGSSIKVVINNNEFSEDQIHKYVKSANIIISIGNKYTGIVALSKALSQCGKSIFIPMSQSSNKKGSAPIGHCHLKFIPPKQQKKLEQKANKNKQQRDNYGKSQNQSGQNAHGEKSMYTWIFLNQFIPLRVENFKNGNIFVRIANSQDKNQPIQTATVWKCASPTFKYIITLLTKQSYHLELWDRQKKQLLIGTVQVKTGFKWQQSLPVRNIKDQVVGYLTLCVGSGSLIDANKFMQLHMKPSQKTAQKEAPIKQKSQASQQVQKQDISQCSQIRQNDQSNQQSRKKEHVIDFQRSPKKHNLDSSLSLLDLHNLVFTRMLTFKDEIILLKQNAIKLTQFQQMIIQVSRKETSILIQTWAISKLASFYLNNKSNKVNMDHFSRSFEAFKNYYTDLQEYRDLVIKQFLNDLQSSGLTINLLQIQFLSSRDPWQTLKQITNNPINVQKLRKFYGFTNPVELCDKFRRFQVFQNTFGQPLPTQEIRNYIIDQLSDIFQMSFHQNPNKLRQILKDSQIQLSKWQQLNIFDSQNKGDMISDIKRTQFIKCPTFGFLGLQNMPAQINNNQQQQNTSIIANISPIYANKDGLWIVFSNIEDKIKKLVVNGIQIALNNLKSNRLKLQNVKKQFSYSVVVQIEDYVFETQGFFNEWMGLTDYNGNYGGCLKICSQNRF